LILILALGLRLGAFISFAPWDETIEKEFVLHADANLYHDLAIKILDHQYPFSDRVSPGSPLLLAMIYSVFGVKTWVVLLLNVLFNLLCIFFTFKISQKLFGDNVAIISSSLLALDIHQIIFTQTLLTDTTFTLLLVLFFFFFTKYIKEKRLSYLFFGGIILAIAVLIRPIGVYFYLFVVLFIFISSKDFIRDKLVRSLTFLIGYFLILAPIIGINYVNFDHFGVSRLGGLNFLYVNAMSVYEIQGKMSHEESIKIVDRRVKEFGGDSIVNPNDKEKLYYAVGLQIIEENFYAYMVNHVNGSINIYTSLSTYNIARIFGEQTTLLSENFFGYPTYLQVDSFLAKKPPLIIVAGFILILVMLFQYTSAAVGIYYLIKKKKLFEFAFLILPLVYLTLVTGVVGNARFKLPISPFFLVISAYGINYLTEKWKQKKGLLN
jgi:4-amino-4-deoxy-L-arabinose transferase-like glycosyltransferase